jgi:hypothetical protein
VSTDRKEIDRRSGPYEGEPTFSFSTGGSFFTCLAGVEETGGAACDVTCTFRFNDDEDDDELLLDDFEVILFIDLKDEKDAGEYHRAW